MQQRNPAWSSLSQLALHFIMEDIKLLFLPNLIGDFWSLIAIDLLHDHRGRPVTANIWLVQFRLILICFSFYYYYINSCDQFHLALLKNSFKTAVLMLLVTCCKKVHI